MNLIVAAVLTPKINAANIQPAYYVFMVVIGVVFLTASPMFTCLFAQFLSFRPEHKSSSVLIKCFLLSLSLQVLRESLEMMVHWTKFLMVNSDSDHLSAIHNHNQLLLRQHLEALDRAASELQVTCLIYSTSFTVTLES